jgi:signal transduction histidine kinase
LNNDNLIGKIYLEMLKSKLRSFSYKLIDFQESERKRIAKELHDGIASNISAVRLMLERKIGENGLTNHNFLTIINALKCISSDSLRISDQLHPSILESIGLSAALKSIIKEFKEQNSGITFQNTISIKEEGIKKDVKLNLYRILQESLTNIVKHSRADRVDITCIHDNRCLLLEVSDNGCGFDVNRILRFENGDLTGLGMESMKLRAECCGGTFAIKSEAGVGTRVSVIVPAG